MEAEEPEVDLACDSLAQCQLRSARKSPMWNRSYRWQRTARLWAGVLGLAVGAGGMAVGLRQPSPANACRALGEYASSWLDRDEVPLACRVPAELGVWPGDLIHRSRQDGLPEIVGKVVGVEPADVGQVTLRFVLSDEVRRELATGGWLRGAPESIGLEQAVRLIVSPEAPLDEARQARDALWPTVEREMVPRLTANLLNEAKVLAWNLEDADRELLLQALEELRTELAPLEDDLIAGLSERAWKEVGVEGVASGIWRVTITGADNARKDMRDWFRQGLGYTAIPDRTPAEFLEDDDRARLSQAMLQELQEFWKTHQEMILEKIEGVLGRHQEGFVRTLRERWAPRLFEHAVVPAWLEGEPAVVKAVEEYAHDFTNRRLVSSAGGPRLVFAHALRGTLGISEAPLLIIEPRTDGTALEIEYRPVTP